VIVEIHQRAEEHAGFGSNYAAEFVDNPHVFDIIVLVDSSKSSMLSPCSSSFDL